ncbi:hypothetical protein [Spiroplasma taiwanense]|uniref:Chitinase n=1 Tax=Spiroplasma taiwanense CT-1 TaxID=1276220 RepID=S5MHP8_9MOLU|nr:hypothetical protein [Spiroplasma taiwanense]AGR41395.1 hypothetical protein STAIW_v1c08070 [Spiroplasma taiwanense CT-1]
MKKVLIISGVITIAFGLIVTPSLLVMQGFVKSLEKYRPDTNEKEDGVVGDNVHDSNQGFENINILNLNTNLGEISDVSNNSLIERIKEYNSVLKNKTIYIKGLSLKKVKFTVENYFGTTVGSFEVSSLDALIKIRQLGSLKNIKYNTIIEKIKELNPGISGMDFSNDLDIKVKSLNQIDISWKNDTKAKNEVIQLEYKPISLESILVTRDLGETNDISENWITNKLLNVNINDEIDISFLQNDEYKLFISDINSQGPENVTISLKYNDELYIFQDSSQVIVRYNANDIVTLIQNTNLGTLDDLENITILNKVKELNPIFARYSNVNNSIIELNSLSQATIRNNSLNNAQTLTFSIENINSIVKVTKIGDISNYNDNNPNEQIISLLLSKNKLLELTEKSNLKIENIRYPSFDINQQTIANVKFDLSITGFTNSVEMSFNIKRQNISTAINITNHNLGELYWITADEIINAIQNRITNENIKSNINYSSPTYEQIELTAKPESKVFYGNVIIRYKTLFKKDSGFNIENTQNGSATAVSFESKQNLGWKVGASNKPWITPQSSFSLKYPIPLSLDEAKNYKQNVELNLTTRPKKISGSEEVSASFLKNGERTNIITENLDQISTNDNYKLFRDSTNGTQFNVPFLEVSWFKCRSKVSYSFKSNLYYSISKTQENNIDYLIIKVKIDSQLSSESYCNDLKSSWTVVINSIDLI